MANIQIRNRVMAAIRAFKEPQLILDIKDHEDFEAWESRLNRYGILWGFYDNTVYNENHKWARQLKLESGLYTSTRAIRSPGTRVGNFQTNIWGGLLDPDAGDGTLEPTALPIITDNEQIRPALSKLWQWSNWQIKKDLYTLKGGVLGDSFLRIVDSTRHGKVYLEVIEPGIVKDLEKDAFGNVKWYVLEEERIDPRNSKRKRKVTYTEVVQRGNGEDVVFQTFLNGSPYPWNFDKDDNPLSEWVEPYGFIPFAHTPHIDVGAKFGYAEMQTGRIKFQEADDQASKINDYVRKATEGLFLFTGSKKPTGSFASERSSSSSDRPEPGREDMPGLWGGKDSGAIPLIHDMNISDALENLESQVADIAKDYPEMMIDESKELAAAISGRALRVLQAGATTKIDKRRPAYDDTLVRAHQMALSIGEMRGYDGFKGIGTFDAGDFEHSIGSRPVFKPDKIDELEENSLFWQTTAVVAGIEGIELSQYLKSQGWTDEQITELLSAGDRRASINARRENRTPIELESTQAVNTETSEDIIEEGDSDE